MLEPIRWLDEARTPLYSLYRRTYDPETGRWADDLDAGVTEHTLPELKPGGQAREIPGTGVTVWTGADVLTPGEYSTKVACAGTTERAALTAWQREIMYAATRTRWVSWMGYDLPIARYTSITAAHTTSPGAGADVTVKFQPKTAYWYAPEETVAVQTGVTVLEIPGESPVALRLALTASQAVTPAIRTDAGVTTFLRPLEAGQTLELSGLPGERTVTVNGEDARQYLFGPWPRLKSGTRSVTITGEGLIGSLGFRAGALLPVLTVPDVGEENSILAGGEW